MEGQKSIQTDTVCYHYGEPYESTAFVADEKNPAAIAANMKRSRAKEQVKGTMMPGGKG